MTDSIERASLTFSSKIPQQRFVTALSVLAREFKSRGIVTHYTSNGGNTVSLRPVSGDEDNYGDFSTRVLLCTNDLQRKLGLG